MTQEEILKHCKYYHGEEKNPYERNSDASAFWQYEKMFADTERTHEGIVSYYTQRVEEYIKRNPDAQNPYTSKEVSMVTKCIMYYIEEMLEKWSPRNGDLIFCY